MLRGRLSVPSARAFRVRKRLSSPQNTKLYKIVQHIVETGDVPELARASNEDDSAEGPERVSRCRRPLHCLSTCRIAGTESSPPPRSNAAGQPARDDMRQSCQSLEGVQKQAINCVKSCEPWASTYQGVRKFAQVRGLLAAAIVKLRPTLRARGAASEGC